MAAAAQPLQFGLIPVFLTSDLELLGNLAAYLKRAMSRDVQLVTRRTYQEITILLVSGQLDAAWICGYPFVQYRTQLDLLAVPVWRGQPLYSAYVIVEASRAAEGFDDLAGDIHALSDPDSNSGYLVTRGLLADKGTSPEAFFRQSFYTYGHRNGIWVAARCEEQDVTSRRTRAVSPVARLHGTEIPKATFTPWTPKQNGRRCPTARVCYAWEDLEKN